MLWIGGQITALGIVEALFLASATNLIVPLLIVSHQMRGRSFETRKDVDVEPSSTPAFERNVMFFLGLGILILVPVFKQVTHLPPFIGILFGLGILWLVGELLHREKDDGAKQRLTVAHALTRIDLSLSVVR
jgi:Na+/H+ antiporter NhaD/arsenite permease-like protein